MTKASKRNSARSIPTKEKKNPAASNTKPRQTKRAQLIRMLKAAKGTDVARMSQTLGWQRHTTRAALTGLRKAGFTIELSAGDGDSVYRITAEPISAPAE